MGLLSNQEHEDRPWGSFDRFTLNELSTVKILTLLPGKRLSLQKHVGRSEFWRVVSGSGMATIGEEVFPAGPGSDFEIPPGTQHRIAAGDAGLVWIEIALGTFDEHDEVRIEDDFGRRLAHGDMSLLLAINWIALAFSFFIAGCLLGALLSPRIRKVVKEVVQVVYVRLKRADLLLSRTPLNPVIRPGAHPWSAEAVLNPAAVYLAGRTHLVYRAIGSDGVSRLGYASSGNGLIFDERLPYPVYVSQNPRNTPGHLRRYSPIMYPSGGSWGGCEDPRMVAIDGRVYVTFNAFDGWDFIRVAFISIAENDFLNKHWHRWSAPRLISAPQERQKNWMLFPEKINGKFAMLHSIAPKIEIAYLDSLDDIGARAPYIKSWVGARTDLPAREGVWDTYIRSAGPPPIRTAYGWLLFYHALEEHDMARYKLGAMLLDLDDPTKVLYRAVHPVLEPDEWYENDGKPGIVYACGAVVHGGLLYIYYGGADKVVCVARAPLEAFLTALMKGDLPPLVVQPAQTA